MNAQHRGKFVAYYRVSANRGGRTGVGLDAQRKLVRDYLNGGLWELVAEFTEIESRRRIKRPELVKALTVCRKLGARLVIAKLNRLSRSMGFMVTLRDSDVDFIAVDKPHVNRLAIHDLARVARDGRELISERTKAALSALKASGKKLGTRNPNRLVNRMAKARKGKAEQFAASVLPMIRAIEALGWTSNAAIAAQLNARKVPTARGKEWTHVQVGQVCMRDGNPNRFVKRMAKSRKAKGERFSARMIRAIEALGWTSNAAIAAQLNARKVPTAGGKEWTNVQVGQVRMRDRKTTRRGYKI